MEKIALLPGGFKPPHAGHYNMAKWLASNTDADSVIIKIGSKERDGITRDISLQLWDLYRKADEDSGKLVIVPSEQNSPVRDVYDFIEQEAPEGSTVYLGMGEKDEEDQRFKNIGKFAEPKGIEFKTVLVPPQAGGVSGTEMRGFISDGDKDSFQEYLPDHLSSEQKDEAWDIVSSIEEDFYDPRNKTVDFMRSSEWKAGLPDGHKKDIPRKGATNAQRQFNKHAAISETRGGESEFHIYDFDETIARSLTPIPYEIISPEGIKTGEGETTSKDFEKDQEELHNLHGKKNVVFNFKAFEKQIENAIINDSIFNKLIKSLEDPNVKTTILTARTAGQPVTRFLKNIGLDAYVEALGVHKQGEKVTGQDKADWIEKRLKKTTKKVYFVDDSESNRSAVSLLQDKYPEVDFEIEDPPEIKDKEETTIITENTALINDLSIPLEIMDTPKNQMQGMIGRDHLEGGMLFPYNEPKERSFHMKGCKIPLDIIFIVDGSISNIEHNCPPCDLNNCPSYKGMGDNVLELPGGSCKEKGINIGDEININSNISQPILNEHTRTKSWWKKIINEILITEGGAAGHMNHPFDDRDLTFGEMKELVKLSLQGNLDIEEAVTEKTDGQNIAVTYKDGKVGAARNKATIREPMDIDAVAAKFEGRGDIKDAFVNSMADLENALKELDENTLNDVFQNGTRFLNMEIIYPETKNVITYGPQAYLQFHGLDEYNLESATKTESYGVPDALKSLTQDVNARTQDTFEIIPPKIVQTQELPDFDEKESYYIEQINKLQQEFDLSDDDRVIMFHQKWWEFNIDENFPNASDEEKEALIKRWAFFEKGFRLRNIADEETRQRAIEYDKNDFKQQNKQNVYNFERIFLELGADVLANIEGFLAANPDESVQELRKDIQKVQKQVEESGDLEVLKKLEHQLKRIEDIGGFEKLVPSEGIVFVYKGKTYKLTGLFAPVNQLIGLTKYV